MRGLVLTSILFCLPFPATGADVNPPIRQGVDIYNMVGSNQRLIAFMKIGAPDKDLRHLAFLNARISHRPLPRAFLQGHEIYFKDLARPLKVIDLDRKLFSYNGARIDLRKRQSIESRYFEVEKIMFGHSSVFSFWDWLLPFAYAATYDPAKLSSISAVLAVGGLTSSTYCLNQKESGPCAREFMGTLAAVGAVGGLRGQEPANSVFCSPDFRGGQTFVVAGEERNLLSISKVHGEYDISPSHLNSGSLSSDNAAAELLESCRAPGQLAQINIALAYPTIATDDVPAQEVAARPAFRAQTAPSAAASALPLPSPERPAAITERRPASTAPLRYSSPEPEEQGGAAR